MTMTHPNEELLRREFDATVAGDMAALIECYADDQVFHYPGKNPAAGEYRGRDGFTKFLGKIGELGVTVTRELHDVVANDEHGIQLISVHGDRTGKKLTWRGVAVMHVRDGKIAETWVHVDDQDALDRFLS